jgi:hypothetical protein
MIASGKSAEDAALNGRGLPKGNEFAAPKVRQFNYRQTAMPALRA